MSQQINLINPLLLKKRHVFGLREIALGLGLILILALGWAGFLHYRTGQIEARVALLGAQQQAAQEQLDRLTAAATRPASALLNERIKATQARLKERETLLGALGGTLEKTSAGFSPRLRALAQSAIQGVWLDGFTLSSDYVELKGSALNAGLLTAYLERLGKQAPFAGMKFSGLSAAAAQTPEADKSQAKEGKVQDQEKNKSLSLPPHIEFALHAGNPAPAASQKGKPNGS